MSKDTRLATYGTLAPGRVNEGQLAGLEGLWLEGTVKGRLLQEGWGAAHGCPGMVLDPDGIEIAVYLFVSTDLPAHWTRLDAFEGPGYRRVEAQVTTEEGVFPAWIYELSGDTAS